MLGAPARRLDTRLIARLRLVAADPCPAAGPGRLAAVAAVAVDRSDVPPTESTFGDDRRPLAPPAPPRVAAGGDEGDAGVAGGGREDESSAVSPEISEPPQLIETTLTPGIPRGVDGGQQVVGVVGGGLDDDDLRAGGDGVGPLDVQRLLAGPAVVGRRAGEVHLGQRRSARP